MQLTIHRGSHQIGGSCVELATDGSRIILDLGLPLPKPDEKGQQIPEEASTSDLVASGLLPDITGLYQHHEPGVEAVIVSHVHGDHCGLASFVHPDIPVYASKGTAQLSEVNAMFLPRVPTLQAISVLPKGTPIRIGRFTVTALLVDHSAPDALALLVESGGKKVLYSGDLRAHGRKAALFERMVAEPPRDVDGLL